nr:hypothetical protein [uncultured Draconibacterium sp.]
MFEKFFKNSMYQGIMIALILVVLVAFVYDDKKNAKRDFFGLLKSSTPIAE